MNWFGAGSASHLIATPDVFRHPPRRMASPLDVWAARVHQMANRELDG